MSPESPPPTARRRQIASFVAAIVFAAAATTSLIWVRIDMGAPSTFLGITVAIMLGLVVLLVGSEAGRAKGDRFCAELAGNVAPQLVGILGVVLSLHAYLFLRVQAGSSILVENPRQLVNDLVLVFGLFGAVRCAVARTSVARVMWLLAAVALVTVYARTAIEWHEDHFEGLAVQRFVVQEVLAGVAGLIVFAGIRRARAAH